MKKILILTVTAGNGHNSNAKAVSEELMALDPNAEIEIVDVLKTYSTKLNSWVADRGYSLSMQLFPHTYNYFFDIYRKKQAIKRYNCAAQQVSMSIVDGIYRKINEFHPDVVYCTHFYPAIALTDLKLIYNLPFKIFATTLDYVVSTFWEATIGADYLCIPNEDFIEGYINKGFKREQLLPYGIPVGEKFFSANSKQEARTKLEIDINKFTPLVIFGGGQWRGGFKIFKSLLKVASDDMQIIMINGKNKKDFNKIEKIKHSSRCKIINVGFTDKVDLYMDACDVVVTKAGGLVTTECINKLKPMIITKKVYGQERYNLQYLESKNAAFSFKNKKELKDALNKLQNDKALQTSSTQNLTSIRKNAIINLCKLMLSQPTADYTKFIAKDSVKKEVNMARKSTNKLINKK